MRHFHETLVVIILIVAIAMFLAGFVWRLFRGGGTDPGRPP